MPLAGYLQSNHAFLFDWVDTSGATRRWEKLDGGIGALGTRPLTSWRTKAISSGLTLVMAINTRQRCPCTWWYWRFWLTKSSNVAVGCFSAASKSWAASCVNTSTVFWCLIGKHFTAVWCLSWSWHRWWLIRHKMCRGWRCLGKVSRVNLARFRTVNSHWHRLRTLKKTQLHALRCFTTHGGVSGRSWSLIQNIVFMPNIWQH